MTLGSKFMKAANLTIYLQTIIGARTPYFKIIMRKIVPSKKTSAKSNYKRLTRSFAA